MAHGTHSGRQVGQGVGVCMARWHRLPRPVAFRQITPGGSGTAAHVAVSPRLTEPAPQLDPVPALLPHGAHSLDDDFNVRASLLAAHWLGNTVLE